MSGDYYCIICGKMTGCVCPHISYGYTYNEMGPIKSGYPQSLNNDQDLTEIKNIVLDIQEKLNNLSLFILNNVSSPKPVKVKNKKQLPKVKVKNKMELRKIKVRND